MFHVSLTRLVWYQHDREVTLGAGDGKPAPPQGKWTKAESKKDWVRADVEITSAPVSID